MNGLSRRNFFKLGASVAAGAFLMNFAQFNKLAEAKGSAARSLKFQPVALKDLPDAIDSAKRADLIEAAYNYILSTVNKISNGELRAKTLDLIKDTRPTFMQMYTSSTDVTKVYNQLADEGLVKSEQISPEQLFPPYNGNKPQDFLTAPGSGYHSHHPYPGGLCTHVGANLAISEGIVNTYKTIFGYEVDNDIVLSAQALHDLAKPWVFQWQPDGSSLKEYTIAGTGAHHILSIAEAIFRKMPAEEIVAQACAHDHPGTPKDETTVVNWIKAASIIAQQNPVQYGLLDKTGTKIPTPHHQEGYIVHLGDHDFVLSGDASNQIVAALDEIAQKDYNFSSQSNPTLFNNFRNYIGSQVSFMYLHNFLAQNSMNAVRELVSQIVIK